MSRNYRNFSGWENDYKAFLSSGLSIRQWCLTKGLSPSTFQYRIRKVKENLVKNKNCDQHHNKTDAKKQTVTIKINGISVKISGDVSIDSISQLIAFMQKL